MYPLADTGPNSASPAESSEFPDAPPPFAQLDLVALARLTYRQWPLIAYTIAATLALALAYLALAPIRYTCEFKILVDPRKLEVFQRDDATAGNRLADPGLIDSQVEILRSDGVLLPVARKLDLADDTDFTQPHGAVGWVVRAVKSSLMSWLPSAPPETPLEKELKAVEIMNQRMKVKRVGLTYVIEVDYDGYDPGKVAAIGAAMLESYMLGELDARYKASRTAGFWLRDRIREVADQASLADQAVQTYKTEHEIVDTSRGLIAEQRLADVSSQLVAASAATAEAKARLDRILEIADSPLENVAVADALHSEVVSRLRAQYLDLASKEADYAARFGADHAAVATIRGQKVQALNAARDELRRIAESTRSDYSIASAREESLKSSLQALIASTGESGQAQGELRNLESAARTYRDLYETLLRNAEETSREQTFPVAADRVITPPNAPREPSWPRPLLVIAGGAALGLFLGVGLAVSREALSNTFRSRDDVRHHAGLDCLGILPLIRRARKADRVMANIEHPPDASAPTPSKFAATAPISRFSQIVREIKVSIDLHRHAETGMAIGVISSVPGEGKTTLGSYLALLCARMGARTALVDADTRGRALSISFAPDAASGLIEWLDGRATLDEIVRKDATTRLDFIPCARGERPRDAIEGLALPAMTGVLTELRARYDYIILDLPPLLSEADVKAIATAMDGFILVVAWGRTPRDVVYEAMRGAREVRRRILGVVLNKAAPMALARIEAREGGRARGV